MKSEIIYWLGIVGPACKGLGSILIARHDAIRQRWNGNCIAAHDESITQLHLIAQGRPQTGPIIEGSSKQLARVEAGMRLPVAGFTLLGIGEVCTVIAHLL